MKVRVLYEDQLAPNCAVKDYSPHRLLLSCLFDRADIRARFPEFHLLANLVEPFPSKGDANVRKHLEKNIEAFNYARIAPIVCLDADKIHRLLKLSRDSCKIEFRTAFWQQAKVQEPNHHGFVLVEQNLEDVLHNAKARGASFNDSQFRSATIAKNLQDRDILLKQVAGDPALRHALAVGDAMPSFRYLVEKTAQLALLDG